MFDRSKKWMKLKVNWKFHPHTLSLFTYDEDETNHAQLGHSVNHSVAHCGLARLWFEWDVLSVDINQSHFAGDLIHFAQTSFQESRTTNDWRMRFLSETLAAFNAWSDERVTCLAVIGTCELFSNWVIMAAFLEKLSELTKNVHQSLRMGIGYIIILHCVLIMPNLYLNSLFTKCSSFERWLSTLLLLVFWFQ